jgi:hypothetical protein
MRSKLGGDTTVRVEPGQALAMSPRGRVFNVSDLLTCVDPMAGDGPA